MPTATLDRLELLAVDVYALRGGDLDPVLVADLERLVEVLVATVTERGRG